MDPFKYPFTNVAYVQHDTALIDRFLHEKPEEYE